jgi:hypothetical protein
MMTVKELKTCRHELIQNVKTLHGHTVKLYQDNQAVCGTLRKMSSKCPPLMTEIKDLVPWLHKGGLIAAEASGQLSCVVCVLVSVDVLTTPVVSGGRDLSGRTRGVPVPRVISRGIIGSLLTLLVEVLLFTGPSINVSVVANLLQTLALVFQGLNLFMEGLAFDIRDSDGIP